MVDYDDMIERAIKNKYTVVHEHEGSKKNKIFKSNAKNYVPIYVHNYHSKKWLMQ
jgi:hypothetical protein